ncbi:MAG: sigma-70 family RNA polymerase sigma factor [Candidatus Margulisiibacteriota bacterium]
MDAAGARYNPKKGPVRLGEYRAVNIARLVGAFRTDEGAKIRERQAIASALIWKYRYLVDVFARKYVGQGASEDELEDAGWEGLHKASLKYDETRGFTFRTYARRWIKSEMQLAIFKKKREIWGGEGRARLIRTVRREELRFKQKNGYDPSDAELAERLGLTEKHVVSLRQSAARRVYSLQAPKNGNGDFLWIDSLPDVSVVDPERKAIAREAHAKIEAALGTLDPRASFILKAHYGDEELSLEKIGEILGEAERGEPLTKEGIRQIEERALRRVRENYPTLASYL